ncbi:hypothetical protein HNR71_007337 [Kribbella sandramycini]|uniref:Uncharacterized protein n=1 Tax=Kribbella sandramycini TaxID=60450 RepID=A0A841SQG1_9ACTN|nr:hypothetical protein [Kribbella sandramycini]
MSQGMLYIGAGHTALLHSLPHVSRVVVRHRYDLMTSNMRVLA